MSQAAAAYNTPVVRLPRAASEPVQQPRMFRHYRRNNPDVAYLPVVRINKRVAARAKAEREKAEEFTRTDVLTILVSAMLVALPEEGKRKVARQLIESTSGASREARGIILHSLGESA